MNEIEIGSYESDFNYTLCWVNIGNVHASLQSFTVEIDKQEEIDIGSLMFTGNTKVESWNASVVQGDVTVSRTFAADERDSAAAWLVEMVNEVKKGRCLTWGWGNSAIAIDPPEAVEAVRDWQECGVPNTDLQERMLDELTCATVTSAAEVRVQVLNEWIELALVAGRGLQQGRPIDGLLCAMLAERSGALIKEDL